MRKPGIAKPMSENTWTVPSTAPPRRAARTPTTTEMIAEITVAPITIDRVTATRLVTLVVTSSPVNQLRPRSPVNADVSQSKYWVSSGRSRPSSSAFLATVSAVAFSPRMRRGMSPPAA